MLQTHSVDTAQVPAADRFDMWLELVARVSAPLRIRSEHAHDFLARADLVGLGPVQLVSYRYPSMEGVRTERLVRQSDPECLVLALTTAGNSASSQAGRYTAGRPGEFTFYDGSRPHEVIHYGDDDGQQPATSLVLVIPHQALPLRSDRLAPMFGARLSGTEGVGALLAQFLTQVSTHPEQYHAADAARLGTVALDLAATMLGRHLVSDDAVPREVRRRALITRIRAYVHRHLGDVTLAPQMIADAHHISLRSLHRLFAAEDTTVAAYIRNLRLTRCRDDLADPARRGQPVQLIASRWGFPDKAHFSRVFRAAYGMSPQEWRDLSLGPARIVNRSASTVNRSGAD
ncbi:helix-turn-helix domain-containing protein [Micromonospora endolithica]|uniref:Helix-turn-helix domain-containing protein n=1 Tax=Micromonospora endolithica TaxID=230091 RepID=A0A3A9YW20_9ACTN|nr:helix-turn-helix domain-containing protein [Micromonospora endolithica]RKN39427.1 helix-turn-helix domain-containing protein [Micromonospora endolithica]TWJ22696.1 transcriptional regulator, AraC family [Micromonospora endolithica]